MGLTMLITSDTSAIYQPINGKCGIFVGCIMYCYIPRLSLN